MSRHGEHIRKRTDGRWEGRYAVYDKERQKNVYRSVYAKSYLKVKEKLNLQKDASYTAGKRTACTCFNLAARDWLEHVQATKKYSTYIKYQMIYEKHLQFLDDKRMCDICSDLIHESLFSGSSGLDRTASESLIKSVYCVINQIICYFNAQYHTTVPSVKRIAPQNAHPKNINIFTQTEQAKLIQYLSTEQDICKIGILLCLNTGLRLGEICSLKWQDIDMKQKTLMIRTTVQRITIKNAPTKTALMETPPKSVCSIREIPLNNHILHLIAPYQNSGKYFLNGNRPMEPRTYEKRFEKYLKEADISRKNFHVLRHTFATNCMNSGIDVKALSEILGHSDVKITLNRYVHPSIDEKRKYLENLTEIYKQYHI